MKNSIVPVVFILIMFSMISCNFNEDDNSPTPTPEPTPTPTWEQVGDVIANNSTKLRKGTDSLKVIDNNFYVTYVESQPQQVIVKKLENDTWKQVGAPITSNAVIAFNSLSSDKNSIPHIAVTTENKEITLYKLDGDAWTKMSKAETTLGENIGNISLSFVDTTLYLAYAVVTANDEFTVVARSHTGNDWTEEKVLGKAKDALNSFSMISFNNKVYIAYIDKSTGNTVIKDAENTATIADPILSSNGVWLELFANESSLYIACEDTEKKVKIHKLNTDGKTWSLITTTPEVNYSWLSAAVDSKSIIYIANYNSVQKYDKSWTPVGSLSSVNYDGAFSPTLALKDNIPYVFMNDIDVNDITKKKSVVKKHIE
ncbi:MAG: hypothetical protein ACRC5H_10170 [Treponemataceae bacterium]